MNALVINYSRSGGTLLSRVLGCLSDVVLVSEVNPNGNADGNISSQMKEWHNVNITDSDFEMMAKELIAYGKQEGKNIVFRDFSFIDFTPHALNDFAPANRLSIYESFSERNGICTFAFVRNAFDVWISRGCPPNFSKYYLNYVEAIIASKIPVFKFEKFCKAPKEELKNICKLTGLKYSAEALTNARNFIKVTGDLQMPKESRGRLGRDIKPLKRKQIPMALINMANTDPLLRRANMLLGYSENYFDFEFEENHSQWKIELVWRVKKALGLFPRDEF